MSVFNEAPYRLEFDSSWRVLKWDGCAAFRGGIHGAQGTKAADFVCVQHERDPWFIEITDYRFIGTARLRKKIPSVDDLATEVACKVRDTLAGVIWTHERDELDPAGKLRPLVSVLVSRGVKITVVLFLEEDHPSPQRQSVVAQRIKQRLRWLCPKVLVINQKQWQDAPQSGLSITFLPRAG